MNPTILGISSLLDAGLVGSSVPGEQKWYIRNKSMFVPSKPKEKVVKNKK
jgi:hypothetical protein